MAAQFDRSSVNLEQCASIKQRSDQIGETSGNRTFQVEPRCKSRKDPWTVYGSVGTATWNVSSCSTCGDVTGDSSGCNVAGERRRRNY
jgi:hypothetical protein